MSESGFVQPESKPRPNTVVADNEAAAKKAAANAWDFDKSLEQIAQEVPVSDDRQDSR